MKSYLIIIFLFTILCLAYIGCDTNPAGSDQELSPAINAEQDLRTLSSAPWMHVPLTPPSEIVSLDVFEQTIDFWPYTGTNFSGTPQDPINLIFIGKADPRDIRAALLSLDGDRTAFGLLPVAPFNAVWDDAIGDVQTGYGVDEGWAGGVVQLACGEYGPARFHIRLFRLGDFTVANAHFEIQIPGTADHQVLSWEIAEQFVMIDLIRSGLLGAEPFTTGEINIPDFKTIPAQIYNLLDVELRAAIEGPLGDVSEDVPIGSNGCATAFKLVNSETSIPETRVKDFIITYGQIIPKPFCMTSEFDYLNVTGDVHLYQTTELSVEGVFRMKFHAEGILWATPVNPLTGEAIGETMEAIVNESHASFMNNVSQTASSRLFQKLVPGSDANSGWFFRRLRVGDKGGNGFEEKTTCKDGGEEMFVSY